MNLNMPTIRVKQNIKKDAWNWWHACNKVSYGEDWKQRIDQTLRSNIVGVSKEQAFSFLIPHLKNIYLAEKINQKKKEARCVFHQTQNEIFSRMEKITGRVIYRDDFTCFLTTFPRAPYDYNHGYVWIPIVWPRETYVRTFMHELLHFQTYIYWQKQCLTKLTNNEFENLKEAVTVILNEECLDVMLWADKGYAMHKNEREELLLFWKKHKNFDALIDHGIELYLKRR